VTEASLAAGLDDIFTIKPAADGAFDAVVPDADAGRPFGGHLIGLAIRAAASTVGSAVSPVPHAVHARFLRAGRTGEPVRLTVASVHDGRTIAVRQLTAVQGARALLTAELSFQADAQEERWQAPRNPLRVPDRAVFSPLAGIRTLEPFEIRAEHEHVRGSAARLHPFWARLREPGPGRDPVLDDPVLNACALAVLTDVGVTASARRPGSPLRVQRAAVTLDHALWLHGTFAAAEWLQVAVTPLVNSGGRGVARGEVSRADGTLVASFVQEVLLRLPGTP
jgi:acyl-CoA thioesterase-2